MSKPQETFVRCEHCDALISVSSPPSQDRYRAAEIMLADGSSMLLPEKKDMGHSSVISGRYCGPKCLIGALEKTLGPINWKYLTGRQE